MKVVLDCSAAVEMARHTPKGDVCRSHLAMRGDDEVLAPDLLYAEVGSAMAKYVRAGLATMQEAEGIVRDAIELVDAVVPIGALHEEAFAEAVRLGHSVYDMFYFVLARRNAATLYSFDKRLNALCEREGISCIHELNASELLARRGGKDTSGTVNAGDGGPGSTVSS